MKNEGKTDTVNPEQNMHFSRKIPLNTVVRAYNPHGNVDYSSTAGPKMLQKGKYSFRWTMCRLMHPTKKKFCIPSTPKKKFRTTFCAKIPLL